MTSPTAGEYGRVAFGADEGPAALGAEGSAHSSAADWGPDVGRESDVGVLHVLREMIASEVNRTEMSLADRIQTAGRQWTEISQQGEALAAARARSSELESQLERAKQEVE